MAQFNINEYNQDNYTEVEFQDGIEYIKAHPGKKLFSDGLEFDEYMTWKDDHVEYEDGCYLGKSADEIIDRICNTQYITMLVSTAPPNCWIFSHKFYLEKEN